MNRTLSDQPQQQQPLKPGNSYCLALLATAKVDISTKALVSTTWRQTRKFIQVRNDTLIFFNKTPCDDLSNATQVIQLRPKHYGSYLSGSTVKINNCPFSFTFPTLVLASQFNTVVQTTISGISQYNRSSSSFHRGLDRSSGYFQTVQQKNPYFPSLSTQLFDPRDMQRVLTVKRVTKSDAFFSTTDLNTIISERIALQTVSSADSPFVQRLFHAYQDKQALYFVTDKPESSDLYSLLKYATDRRISESSARYIFAEAVIALSDVHDCGIAFGDFTPSKLGITESGHVKLCDFTHATHIASETPRMTMPPYMPNSMESFNSSTTSSTESTGYDPSSKKPFEVFDNTSVNALRSMDYGNVLPMTRAASKPLHGTRGFLSPEQLINTAPEPIDATAVDVWALGITLYMMVTGRHPFLSPHLKISNRAELEQFMSTKTLKFPSFVSYELKQLLRGMLEKNPLERYTISDVRQSAWMQTVDWANMRKSAEQEHIVDEIVALMMQSRMRRITIPINTPNEDDANSVWSLDQPTTNSMECTQRRVYPTPFPWRKYRVRASSLDVLRRSPRPTCYNLLGFEFNHDSFR